MYNLVSTAFVQNCVTQGEMNAVGTKFFVTTSSKDIPNILNIHAKRNHGNLDPRLPKCGILI